jgi:hypothetical protein
VGKNARARQIVEIAPVGGLVPWAIMKIVKSADKASRLGRHKQKDRLAAASPKSDQVFIRQRYASIFFIEGKLPLLL